MTTRFKPKPMDDYLGRLIRMWTHVVEQQKPRGRCRGCALRQGTLANQCGDTAAKVAQTILWGGDFRCHHMTGNGRVTTDDKLANRQCRGFAALLAGLRMRYEEGAALGRKS